MDSRARRRAPFVLLVSLLVVIASLTGAPIASAHQRTPTVEAAAVLGTEPGLINLGEKLPDDFILYDSVCGPATACLTTKNTELYAQNRTTGQVYQLTANPQYDSWWPKISPDRKS